MTSPASSLSTYRSQHPDFKIPSSHSSPLPSLYSSLSTLRTSNLSAYQANLEWWTKTISDVTWRGAQTETRSDKGKGKAIDDRQDRIVFYVDETTLDEWTVEEVGRPMGIATVVLDMASSSQVYPLAAYLNSSTPIAGPSKARSSYIPSARTVVGVLVGKPLWWALSTVGIGGSSDEAESDVKEWKRAKGKWVVWDNLQLATNEFLSFHYSTPRLSPLDSLFTLSAFKAHLASCLPHLSELDTRLLLLHLSRDRNVAALSKGLVKLAEREDEVVEAITEQDRGLIAIKETQAKLEAQIADLESRMAECDLKVTTYLRAKQKSQALASLKQKKALEEVLNKRLGSKTTLDGVILKIEQASGDLAILSSYETSTNVLKKLLSDPKLQIDRVEGTMAGLEDALADQKEIDDAIIQGSKDARRAANGGEEVDEDAEEQELAQEMARLELEEQEEQAKAESEEKERLQKAAEEERKAKEAAEVKRKEDERRREQEQKEKAAEAVGETSNATAGSKDKKAIAES